MKDNRKLFRTLLLISGLLYSVSQVVILKILSPVGLSSVGEFQRSFDRQSVAAVLGRWGEQGIAVFKTHFYLDFFHPWLYGTFLFSALVVIRNSGEKRAAGPAVPLCFFLPYAAAAADIIENFIELSIINDPAGSGEWLFFCNGLVSSIKWLLAAVTIVMLCVNGIRALAARRHGRI